MCELRKFRKAANYSPWVVFVEETQKLETRSENSSASDAPELAAAGLFRFGCWACKAYEAQPLQVGRGGHSSKSQTPSSKPKSRQSLKQGLEAVDNCEFSAALGNSFSLRRFSDACQAEGNGAHTHGA